MPRTSGQPRYRGTYKGISIDLTAKTAAELEEKVRSRKNEIDAGLVVGSAADITVRTWSQKWLKVYKRPSIDAKNYKNYETNLNLHILPEIGAKKLCDVKPVDLQQILNAHGDKSRSHVGHIKDALTGMFREAFRNGYIPRDPALGLKIPDSCSSGTHRKLTKEETDLFLQACEYSQYGPAFLLEYYAGLRPIEIIKLRRKNITEKYISITETKNPKKKEKPAGVRDIPIIAKLRPTVEKIIEGKNPEDLLFLTDKGKQLTSSYLSHRWDSVLRWMDIAAGAELDNNKVVEHKVDQDLNQYDLRHTFCTNLESAGIPINVARQLMGHESVDMTARIYTHTTTDVIDAAGEKMDAFEG